MEIPPALAGAEGKFIGGFEGGGIVDDIVFCVSETGGLCCVCCKAMGGGARGGGFIDVRGVIFGGGPTGRAGAIPLPRVVSPNVAGRGAPSTAKKPDDYIKYLQVKIWIEALTRSWRRRTRGSSGWIVAHSFIF